MDNEFSRRQFMKDVALTSAGLSLGPYFAFGKAQPFKLMKRAMGRLGFETTTLGLGGQGSLQWTPSDVDPAKIILKAFEGAAGNYTETAKLLGLHPNYLHRLIRNLDLKPELTKRTTP